MPQKNLIWLDGKFVPWKKATVHVFTHALHYGSSVFEGIRFYPTAKGPKIFRLDDHLDRFLYSASTLCLEIPFSKKELRRAALQIVKKSGLTAGYLRPLAFFGESMLSINPIGVKPQTMMAVFPWLRKDVPLKIMLSPYMRIHPKSTKVDAKIAGHYVNSILALQDARKHHFDEVILQDAFGHVGEAAVANIFMVKNGKVYTPSVGTILPGITRDTIITLCRNDLLIPIKEKKLTISEIVSADEVFLAGTAYEVSTVARIGKKNFKIPGPVTERLRQAYSAAVHGRLPRYHSWLA